MTAGTLHCPACGAAASGDATQCEHCGAGLATVACPSCFGMVFRGATFCAHCGVRVGEIDDGTPVGGRGCPECREPLRRSFLGPVAIEACSKCDGLWLDAETFKSICADRERQSVLLDGVSRPPEPARLVAVLDPFRYRPCPTCAVLMPRVNFAGRSGVIVDTCREHGTWFDRDELRRIVEFIRGGGVESARRQEIAWLREERRLRPNTGSMESSSIPNAWSATPGAGWDAADIVLVVARVIVDFFL